MPHWACLPPQKHPSLSTPDPGCSAVTPRIPPQRLELLLRGGRGAGEAHQRELHRAADDGPASTARRLALAARRVLPGGRGGGGGEEQRLQVLLRLQISRPRLHNVLTTFKLSLAGAPASGEGSAGAEVTNQSRSDHAAGQATQ